MLHCIVIVCRLTDEESRENWEKYGNPDGPQAASFGIALPSWIVEKQNSVWVLGLYLLVFIIVLPVIVVSDTLLYILPPPPPPHPLPLTLLISLCTCTHRVCGGTDPSSTAIPTFFCRQLKFFSTLCPSPSYYQSNVSTAGNSCQGTFLLP